MSEGMQVCKAFIQEIDINSREPVYNPQVLFHMFSRGVEAVTAVRLYSVVIFRVPPSGT
jgi:hypothetical protein